MGSRIPLVGIYPKEINQDVKERAALNKELHCSPIQNNQDTETTRVHQQKSG